ncbi:MAG: hypothetical protein ACJAVV_001872 [Alphaproteobacteria bacterium]|jgi:hypothetical protein
MPYLHCISALFICQLLIFSSSVSAQENMQPCDKVDQLILEQVTDAEVKLITSMQPAEVALRESIRSFHCERPTKVVKVG